MARRRWIVRLGRIGRGDDGKSVRRVALGEQRAGGLVIGLGEYQMAHRLRHEAKLALVEILAGARQDRIRAAHIFDVFLAAIDRRQGLDRQPAPRSFP